MALSRVVSEIFNVEKRRDLEIGVRDHSSVQRVVPWQRTHCHSSTALSIALCFMSAQTAGEADIGFMTKLFRTTNAKFWHK